MFSKRMLDTVYWTTFTIFHSRWGQLLTAVITLGAVNQSFWSSPLVGLFPLLANATYSIGNDLRLQGQNDAIKTTSFL